MIDAGISCKETEKRMELLGLSMKKVKAIFISHEHDDHIKGVSTLSKKYNLPVYITPVTLTNSRVSIDIKLTSKFKAYEPVQVGGLFVTAFPKHHDAQDPHSFIITYNDITVGVFTDIGAACSHVTTQFSKCHAAFLETNYDEQLLENGCYPLYLKNRIRNGKGHLSNKQALDIFIKQRPPFMTHLLLSHLSKDNNCPELAKKLFEEHASNTKIIVASRFEPTEIYSIHHHGETLRKRYPAKLLQLNLFEAMEIGNT